MVTVAATRFRDRTEAGQALAVELSRLVAGPLVVAALSRGGVVVGRPVADRLGAPLAVVHVRKLTVPAAPDLAWGALDEDGEAVLEEETLRALGLGPEEVRQARARTAVEVRWRAMAYRDHALGHRLPAPTVVLVDDGMATGLSMLAAVGFARRHGAGRVVVATPCASAPALRRVQAAADSVVTLALGEGQGGVSRSYTDFPPVTDEAALRLLGAAPAAGDRVPGLALAFRNPAGLFLAGEVRLPPGDGPHPAVVLAHRLGSRADTPRNRATARALTARGLAVLGFDFTGHGDSEGIVEDSTLPRQAEDLGAALTALEGLDEVDSRRLGVLGVESGAAPALVRAASDPRIRALVLRSPRVREALDAVPRVHAPTLVIAGGRDPDGAAAAAELVRHLGGARRLATVAAGDRLFHDPEALAEAGALAAEWFRVHLVPAATAAPERAAAPPDVEEGGA